MFLFRHYLAVITQDYHTDPVFATHINQAVKRHQHKGDSTTALSYVLEECAGTLTLLKQEASAEDNPTLTYPGKLNKPVQYALKQHVTGHTPYFLDYKLDTKMKAVPQRKQTHFSFWTHSPIPTNTHDKDLSASIGRLIDNSLPASPALRCDFLEKLMLFCDHYHHSHRLPPALEEAATDSSIKGETDENNTHFTP